MDEEQIKQEAADDKLINDAFQKLLDSYLSSRHRKKVDLITKAFNFARQAHKGVRRLSGEPYIMHPISVAQIACEEVGLGSTSICSALLHDVVEGGLIEGIEALQVHASPLIAGAEAPGPGDGTGRAHVAAGLRLAAAAAGLRGAGYAPLPYHGDVDVVAVKGGDLHAVQLLQFLLVHSLLQDGPADDQTQLGRRLVLAVVGALEL